MYQYYYWKRRIEHFNYYILDKIVYLYKIDLGLAYMY